MLLRGGVEVQLPERSLRLLEVLVESAGSTISKDKLIEQVWRGAFVSDTSLTEAMSRLRHALGDGAREPRYVRTIHRRGYRFIAPVRTSRERLRNSVRSSYRWLRIAAVIAIGLFSAAVLFSLFPDVGGPRGIDAKQTGKFETSTRGSEGFDPLRGLARFLVRVAPPISYSQPPRYRLAELQKNGQRLIKYGIPALPLNGLSVDQIGQRVAFSIRNGKQSDAWVYEPRKGELRRVTAGGYFSDPVFSPQGESIALASRRDGSFDLVLKSVDGDESEQILLEAPLDQFPESWSRDGRSLVYSERHPNSGYDLWLLEKQSDQKWDRRLLVRTTNDEAFGAISPDGRYVAFVSSHQDQSEVFVTDLKIDQPAIKVSRDGGAYPFWSSAGNKLHFIRGDELRTAALDQFGADAYPATRSSSDVAGLYLAGSDASDDRFVVAMLE